jgi:tetratricopeptide (TPR) repeat protein
MQMAAEAGLPGDEGTEWTRVQLGQLYEKTGDLLRAKMHYTIALDERPNYAYAYSGLARLATADKNYPEAIRLYLKADSLVNDFAIKEELSEVYTLAGQNDKSLSISKRVVDDMSKIAEAAVTDENIGHYSDRELAYAYLKVNDNERALKHAIAEWNRRPKNIDVNETVAWVYYKMNQPDKSVKYITEALKTNNKNPVLLSRAGLIYLKLVDKAKAKSYLEEALKHQPNFTPSLKAEATTALATL